MARKPAALLTREELMAMLTAFVNQRPGFDPCNYGTASSYRSDQRTAQRQRSDALEMLAAIGWRESITAHDIRKALQGSGRLQLRDDGRLDYCTGQYWPTEFRAGVCRVLSQLLWDYWRENSPAELHERHDGSWGNHIRATARRELGRGVAQRWFR